jgi:hypothetical protein
VKIELNKTLKLLIILFLPSISFAQTNQDNIKNNTYHWNALALHAGIGIHQSLYYEFGPSFVRHWFDGKQGFGSTIFYSTFEYTPSDNLYGIKVGGELGSNFLMSCLDLKYQFNNTVNDFVITPKIGFGLGVVNLYYGYNFSTSKYPFPNIGKHQFSVTFNLTQKYMRNFNREKFGR